MNWDLIPKESYHSHLGWNLVRYSFGKASMEAVQEQTKKYLEL